jgi:hypothetical protein
MTPEPADTVAWAAFAAAEPDLAGFGASLFDKPPAYLATLRPDHTPRVHPVTPIVTGSGLYVFTEPTSPKAADLRQRAWFAMHNGVPDTDGTGGEFFVRGTGHLVEDPAIRDAVAAGASYKPAPRYILFELRLHEARGNGYGDVKRPARPRWVATAN